MTKVATVHERIAAGRQLLIGAGIPPLEAAMDAEVLARHCLGCDRAALIVHGRDPVPAGFEAAFAAALGRRAAREPVALVTGRREFWGLELEVTRDVLIPRPETELIVETSLRAAADGLSVNRIVDVGTGSGCIAVALLNEFRAARCIAIDSSAAALTVAARNARRHAVDDRLQLVRSNVLDAVAGPVDLLVSNPPYVPIADASTLQPEVVRYEPALALFGGDDGLAVLRALIGTARPRLAPGGALIVEFGVGQADEVRALANRCGWRDLSIAADLQGIPRVALMWR